jgi:ATP-dependent Clp protease ATP-binding subunit ClpA
VTALEGFDAGARRAVETAAAEAASLGHGAVGTEHLLLGVLLGDDRAAAALSAAGATVAAARHKVAEAGRAPKTPADGGSLPLTSRAERALGRAVRVSHQARAEAVDTGHVLLGVLDVEGTAGQVLRGIGVDVARLRTAITSASAEDESAAPPPPATAPVASPTCGSCGTDVEELVFTKVRAVNEEGRAGEVVMFSCRSCGTVLGVAPPRA